MIQRLDAVTTGIYVTPSRMSTSANQYADHLHSLIDGVVSGVSQRLDQIESVDPVAGHQILATLLAYACQATNVAAIMAGRRAIARIPANWLVTALRSAIKSRLNLDDEWEYRRLLELLKEVQPAMLPQFVKSGLSSPDIDVREAASEFADGPQRQSEGLADSG